MNDPEQPGNNKLPLTNNAQKGASSFEAKPVAAASTKTARPRNAWTYLKWGVVSIVTVGALAAGTAFGYLYHNSSEVRSFISSGIQGIPTIVRSGGDITAPWTPENQHLTDKGTSINVLILGCDHDYDDRTQKPVLTTPGRSDSILMAHVDFTNGTIKCLTIPRDTAVSIPEHRGLHKINAAHEFGDNDLTVRTIKERFGLDTDYYVTLDFESFQKVVNALGGVDVNIHKPLNYDDNWGNLHVHLKPGMQHLNGYQAMGYVRIRHSDSDLARSERQHEFLEAVRSKVNPTIITKLPNIFSAITSDMHSNLNQDQLIALANFARKLKPEQIQLITLPNLEGSSYCYIYQDKATPVIAELFYEGDQTRVQLDLPNWDRVASLNSSRGLNSSGEAGGDGSGRRRRSRRHGSAASEAGLPRDDSGNPLADTKDDSDTATDLSPVDGSSEEKVSDGKRSHRKRHTDTSDTSDDTQKSKDKDSSSDSGSKDSGKDSGDKSDKGDKSDSGFKDTGSKSDGNDKGDKSGGDKTDTTGDKTGGAL